MEEYAELEIGLHRWRDDSYRISLRYTQPSANICHLNDEAAFLRLDQEELCRLALDEERYGAYLGRALLGSREVELEYARACTESESTGVPLYVRLAIGSHALRLHDVRWELLRYPRANESQPDEPLFTTCGPYWSRYLSGESWRAMRLRRSGHLRALALIASPSDLGQYGLQPIEHAALIEDAREALGETLDDISLCAPGQARLDLLLQTLQQAARQGRPFDLLYLVAHGCFADDESWLFLEDEQGASERIAGSYIVERLRQLEHLPRLVVLAACRGAGNSAGSALTALGPRLAASGVPAVLAMQGDISTLTMRTFMGVFMDELKHKGLLDQAVARARAAVRDCLDWWMPVLFTRLRDGKIWYEPTLGRDSHSLERWPAIINEMKRQRCVPILGHGMIESLVGSQREIARRWAEVYRFPLAPHEREDLTQVAQYLAIHQSVNLLRDALSDYIYKSLSDRFGADLDHDQVARASLDELVSLVGAQLRQRNPQEPHLVLARLKLPLYITCNPDNLLVDALKAEGVEPVVEICRWRASDEAAPSIYEREPDYKPSSERPLVFYMFGKLDCPDSLVLSEDDYLDYLIAVMREDDPVRAAVRAALTEKTLVFIGFHIDDWAFRVLWRQIANISGNLSQTKKNNPHVAVQIAPEEDLLLPANALSYLEEYLQQGIHVNVYWGNTEDFFGDLVPRLEPERRAL